MYSIINLQFLFLAIEQSFVHFTSYKHKLNGVLQYFQWLDGSPQTTVALAKCKAPLRQLMLPDN